MKVKASTKRATAVLVRQEFFRGYDRNPFYIIQGRKVFESSELTARRVVIGELDNHRSPYELDLPPCPDCGGGIVWAEAGYVPGTRECVDCGSFFSIKREDA